MGYRLEVGLTVMDYKNETLTKSQNDPFYPRPILPLITLATYQPICRTQTQFDLSLAQLSPCFFNSFLYNKSLWYEKAHQPPTVILSRVMDVKGGKLTIFIVRYIFRRA